MKPDKRMHKVKTDLPHTYATYRVVRVWDFLGQQHGYFIKMGGTELF